MKKKSILLLPLILFGMVIAGCHGKKSDSSGKQDDTPVQPSGGEDTPSGEDVVHVSSVSVSPTSLNLEVGDTGNLTATVMPVNATNKTVTWSSSNSSFASVSNGVVTAVAKGQATITATADGKSGTCVVTVTDKVIPPNPGPGPQPPEPTESPFGVKIGAGEIQNIPVNEEFVPSGNQLGAYKLEGLNVKAGDTLAFYNETVAISENLGPNPDGDQNYNNYCGSLADGFTVQADAASATLYLDYYGPETDEGHDWLGFFLTGGTSGEHGDGGSQTQVAGVVHYGQGASWEDAEMEPFNESGYDELRVVDLNLEEGIEFAIRIGDDDWRHFGDGKNEAAIESGDIVDAGGNDHNFKVANAGKYSIYAKVEKGQDEKTVYIAKTGEYVHVEHTYGLIGEYSGYNWDHDEEMILNEGKTEASVENIPLHEGDLIKVRLDGKWTHAYGWESLSVKPEGAFKDGGEPDHNIEVVEDGIYDIKFIIATSKIEITGHPVPATPVSLDCEYKGGEVETGHALDAEKVFVYVKYSDDSKGTDNVAADAHYFIEDTEVEKTQVFTEPGSYEITVKYTLDEQELQGTMTVIVVAALVDLEGITPTPAETTLIVGGTQQISLTFNPENASDKNVEYASDDEDVATVSETGLITAVAVGSATITINGAQGVSATVDVTVEETVYAGKINNTTPIAFVDDSTAEKGEDTWVKQFKATITASAGDVLTFTYGDEAIYPGAGLVAGNNVSYDETEHTLTVIQDVTGQDLYLKVYESGYSVWLMGYVEPVWVAMIDSVEKATVPNPSNENEIQLTNVELEQNAKIYFQKGDVTIGYNNVYSDNKSYFTEGAEGEMVAAADGTYSFYVNFADLDNIVIYATYSTPVEQLSIIGKIGEEDWDNDHDMTITAGIATISDLALAAGDEFKIRANHDWAVSYGYSELDIQDDDIAVAFGNKGGNIKVIYGGTYNISFNLSTGKIDITGAITDPIPEGIQVTFKLMVDVGYGNNVSIAGDFNGWTATAMEYADGGWTITLNLDVEVGNTVTFKFIKNGNIWENNPNRTYTIVDGTNVYSSDSVSWQS